MLTFLEWDAAVSIQHCSSWAVAALNTLESADGVGVSTGGSTGRSTSAVDLTRYTALYINWNCWSHMHRENERE